MWFHDPGRDRAKGEVRKQERTADTGTAQPEPLAADVRAGEIRLKIEGMMCEHCEATVKKALENLEGVKSAAVNHKEGIAVVQTDGSVSLDDMRRAVEAEDYTVIG